MIDIGANLTDPRFASDLPDVLQRARAAGVTRIIVTGTSLANAAQAIGMCATHGDFLRCTVGIHPHEAARAPTDWPTQLRELGAQTSVCAIGETGLDFNRDFSPRDQQEAVFLEQLHIAADLAMPLFVHERDTQGRVATLLAQHRARLTGIVVHCFTGDAEDLAALLAMDCYIGITGWVCDERRGQELARLLPQIPLARLLIETDAPYLTPRSLPNKPRPHRNEPAFLAHIAEVVARIRGEDLQTLQQATRANACQLFKLPA